MPRSAVFDGVARQLALALESAALRDRIVAQRQLEREVALAQQIQASFLPSTLPQPEGWDLAAFWHPARLVGGDFYDVVPLRGGGRFGLVVADVAGNGVPAALYMALSRTLLRSIAIRRTSPATTLSRRRPLALISEVPTDNGETRRTEGSRLMAKASSTVRSRGVVVSALAGLKPPVAERPGSTMTRLLPSDENCSTT